MTEASRRRSVHVERTAPGRLVATNVRGGSIEIGTGDDATFTPVELLLAAIGGCTGIDVDMITRKRAEPDSFVVTVSGDSVKDDNGHHVTDIAVDFAVAFPAGESGDAARDILPAAISRSHDRLCTVSRTIELGATVTAAQVPAE